MIARLFKLSSFITLIVIIGYLYHFNSQELVLFLGPQKQLKTRAAHIVLGLFLSGFLVASFFASIVRIRHHFAMRALEQERKRDIESQKQVEDARSFLALGDAKQAQQILQRAYQKNPKNALVGVLLARATHQLLGAKPALEIIEKMRAEKISSSEALLFASDLNRELGNESAALDNISLLLKELPSNIAVIEKAVAANTSLNRFENAIELQSQLVQRASGQQYDEAQNKLALLKVRLAIHRHGDSNEKLKSALESIIKEHRDFPEAVCMLAEIEEAQGSRDTATKLRRKLFSLSGQAIHLETIARCWLSVDRPDTALAQIQSAISERQSSKGSDSCIESQLFEIHLLLQLEMIEQAGIALNSKEELLNSNEYALTYSVLKARYLSRAMDLATAFSFLVDTLSEQVPLLSGKDIQKALAQGNMLDSWAKRLSEQIQLNA